MRPAPNKKRHTISRRRLLQCLGAGAAAAIGLPVYATMLEPRWLRTTRHTVTLPGLKKRAIRILHLSDLHYSRTVSLEHLSRAVDRGLEENPDLICLTGDYVTDGVLHQDGYVDVLQQLSRNAPTFATLGNHDGGLWAARRGGDSEPSRVRKVLQAADITILHNRNIPIRFGKERITICGVGDLWSRAMHPQQAFAHAGRDPRIVLCHNPDAKQELAQHRWELVLCGHTHGGQLSAPIIGQPFAPVQDKRFIHGLYNWQGRFIHVTSGVGNIHGVRLNCRPEVALLTLVPA